MIHCELVCDFAKPDALWRTAQRERSACTAERFKFGIRTAAVLLLVTAVSGGCLRFQDYRPEPVSAPMRAEALENRTLDNPRLQMFIAAATGTAAFDAEGWDLGKLTLAAIYYHPDIELARSKLQTSSAAVITAAEIPNPTLSVDLMPSPFSISPAIDFLIETFNRREYRTNQAQALVDAARDDLTTAGWQVRGRVRTALLNLWAARQRIALQENRLSLQDQLVQLLERRLAEGEASSLDVTRERINRNQFSLTLRDTERQSADARALLAAAVGVPVQAFDNVMISYDVFSRAEAPPAGNIAELRRQALIGRADVQSLLGQYRAAESSVRLEIAKQYPNVDLTPGYTFEPSEGYKFTAAASAALPIFNQNQGPIAEADARRRAVAAQLTSVQAQIIGAIDDALANYRAATVSVQTADALRMEAKVRNDQVMRSLEAGEADRPTLVSAGIELATSEIASFEAGVQQLQAIGSLEDALEQPLFEPEAKFSVPEIDPAVPMDTAQ